MFIKKIVFTVLIWCSVFATVYPTLILLNALKKGVQQTRCKLHQIGTKIIHHDHRHGDPCEENPVYYGHNNLPADVGHHQQISQPSFVTDPTVNINGESQGADDQLKENVNDIFGKGNEQIEIPKNTIDNEEKNGQSDGSKSTEIPVTLDIDIRLGEGSFSTPKLATTTKAVPVSSGEGKSLIRQACRNGQVWTSDGCLTQI